MMSGTTAWPGFGWRRPNRIVDPGLACAPQPTRGEVNPEWPGGTVGRQNLRQSVAKLGKCRGKCVQPGERCHACQMKRVSGLVEVAVEGCWVLASQRERDRRELKAAGCRCGGALGMTWIMARFWKQRRG